MHISGNTILITGGGSGIGRALAEAFHAEGNQVIIAGRRENALQEVTKANSGMKSVLLNIENGKDIRKFVEGIAEQFSALNVVINNAGIMRVEDLQAEGGELSDAEATVNTNLLGPMRLTAALLPLLKRQSKATIMTVSSGLAFVPMAMTPTYCATKAAIHSYSQALRYQLRKTTVEVVELIPPYVQTELLSAGQATDPNAMPLDKFIAESMEILKTQPGVTEVCVKNVNALRYAAESGHYGEFFTKFNDAMTAAAAGQ